MHLDAVTKFCKSNCDSGKIVPINFDFPSFSITETSFKKSVIESVSDKIRLALENNHYGNHKLLPGITYDDFLAANKAKISNTENQEQKGINIYCDKILPVKMANDVNLKPLDIARNSLNSVCSEGIQSKLFELEHLKNFSVAYGEQVSTYQVEKDKFVATMIMIQEKLPSVHKDIELSLKESPFKGLVSELKDIEKNPDIGVIGHINNFDPKFAQEKFPKYIKSINKSKSFSFN